MELQDLFDFHRDKMQNIIFHAEVSSREAGVSVMEMLEQYANEFRKTKPIFSEKITAMTRQLKSGKKRWKVYSKYVDSDVLNLLEIGEKKSIPAGKIIDGYMPAKRLTSEFRKNIKTNLIAPIGGALFLTTLLGYAVQQYAPPMKEKMVIVPDSVLWLSENYYAFNFSIILVAATLLYAVPHKIPILNKIFKKLDSMLALATIETMSQVGYASAEIIPSIKKQFKLDFEPGTRDVNGLMILLKKADFITEEESAELKISSVNADIKAPIRRLMKQRENDAGHLSAGIGKFIKTATIILTAIPVGGMVYVMMAFMTAATSMRAM